MSVTAKKVLTARVGRIVPYSLSAYRSDGGYTGLKKALGMGPEAVIAEVSRSGLSGRGGASFPTGLKWQFTARQAARPKALLCNADEGELGTRKDRLLLDGDPFSVLEGMTIAAFAIGAEKGGIYVNGDWTDTADRWEKLLEESTAAGVLGRGILGSNFNFFAKVYRGLGVYIAGEEFALIASIEGRRATSRPKPPYPAEQGLFGLPTCINNVETLANVPQILSKGADWFLGLGLQGDPGTRIVTISGDVKRETVCEIEVGSCTLREAIEAFGGGTRHGRPLKAVQPGGGSSAFLPASRLDIPFAREAIRKQGSSVGTGGLIVYEEGHSIVDGLLELFAYYGRESCGRCSPCRVGVKQTYEILRRIRGGDGEADDLNRLAEIGRACVASSTCGMGQAFPLPVLSALEHFPGDFQACLSTCVR